VRVSPKSSPFERKGKKKRHTTTRAWATKTGDSHTQVLSGRKKKYIYKNEITQENAGVNSKHTVQK